MSTARICILASGNGTNAEAIFNYFKKHSTTQVTLVLSNNPNAAVLERAKKFGIESGVFTKSEFNESDDVVNRLLSHSITHIVLAGFLWLLPKTLISAYSGKMINIHPALLPKFGGKGMYGMKIHEAVKQAGETKTGITIHEVNEHYDKGQIIFQTSCAVLSSDTPEQIASKIHDLEYQHYPRVIAQWVESSMNPN
ncbi:MAG: phosphoribosylglycinamide formyltransferase [Cyclobacteriaceae bacterium]|nr:phosphoribosylglycinamide formyltransferase [Cyclobacteriaceae bacterium]